MKNPEVTPVANLEQRIAEWKFRKWSLMIKLCAVAGAVYSFVLGIYFVLFILSSEATVSELFIFPAKITAVVILPVSIISILRSDRRPTQADVDAEVELRRSLDIDATISQ